MDTSFPVLKTLFLQLGLPASEAEIAKFITTHAPLAPGVALCDAPFWSPAQAQFLREAIAQDATWSEAAETLALSLSR
jgi:hypothetical protein